MAKTYLDSNTVNNLRNDINNTDTSKIDIDAQTAHDDIKDFYDYKKHLRDSAKKQIDFKDNIRKTSLVIFGVIALILSLNLFVMLYLQGFSFKIWGIPVSVPHYDIKLIIFFASATFINVFGIITFLFNYIFSSTTDILKHNKDLSE